MEISILVTSNYTVPAVKVCLIVAFEAHKYCNIPCVIKQMTWLNARAECKKIGMSLVNVETKEENECIKSIVAKQGFHDHIKFVFFKLKKSHHPVGKRSNYVFHGLTRIGTTNYKKWLSGAPVTFTNWKAGQPTLDYGCAAFRYKTLFCREFQWHNIMYPRFFL
jgi:Lectin C-type domain